MGHVDIHSHILPNMDDGAPDMEETMRMLRIAESEGITHIIATPHYKSGRYPADADKIQRVLRKVRECAALEGIGVKLYAGNEIYYNSELEEKLEDGRLCTLNGTDRLLVEFSPLEEYRYVRNAMEDLLGMGYIPILAHAERYQCMYRDKSHVPELRNMGCEVQINASTVTGGYGFKAAHFARGLMKRELVDYIGTDAHNTDGRAPRMQHCAEWMYRHLDAEYAEGLLGGNAMERMIEEI